tara:strand:+ start:85 stop:951 length:867 start_codon:yes stop_codon:yes gene_type:complete
MSFNVKHSKYKNTGLIFEFLLRQITVDVLNDETKSFSLNLIKKSFNENSELGKELRLYNVLIKEKLKSDKKADYLISEVLKQRTKLSNSILKREKYNLIKSIKENYNVNQFFSSKVPEYKIYASIYKLFEYNTKLSPEDKTESYFNILENITTPKKSVNLSETLSGTKLPNDEDLRIITYRTLLEKFNKKYTGLNGNQRHLLRAYINNVSNTNYLKEYIEKKIPYLRKELKNYIPSVKNKVVKIKLNEAINSINKFCKIGKGSTVKDSVVVQMMRYYELLKELKNAQK